MIRHTTLAVVSPEPIMRRRIATFDHDLMFRRDLNAGNIRFVPLDDPVNEIRGMTYVCPCGCGGVSHVIFKPYGDFNWNWDVEKPTIYGELYRHVGCLWFGQLINGEFIW